MAQGQLRFLDLAGVAAIKLFGTRKGNQHTAVNHFIRKALCSFVFIHRSGPKNIFADVQHLGTLAGTKGNFITGISAGVSGLLKFTQEICKVLLRMRQVHFIKEHHQHTIAPWGVPTALHLIERPDKFRCLKLILNGVVVSEQ